MSPTPSCSSAATSRVPSAHRASRSPTACRCRMSRARPGLRVRSCAPWTAPDRRCWSPQAIRSPTRSPSRVRRPAAAHRSSSASAPRSRSRPRVQRCVTAMPTRASARSSSTVGVRRRSSRPCRPSPRTSRCTAPSCCRPSAPGVSTLRSPRRAIPMSTLSSVPSSPVRSRSRVRCRGCGASGRSPIPGCASSTCRTAQTAPAMSTPTSCAPVSSS